MRKTDTYRYAHWVIKLGVFYSGINFTYVEARSIGVSSSQVHRKVVTVTDTHSVLLRIVVMLHLGNKIVHPFEIQKLVVVNVCVSLIFTLLNL